ncbi:helix-turn-helix domain-containing protein [Clostridium taeniosporum]|uniref:XRE family transcriptional regulator n=1 Tax=Clostridium taeniosporum TaxID=394958 RepID=A0A1D7XM77_9CLOT|nr:helix-turn-helix transcriptional regulator [Clostridium taeniosporum]AOR24290.1 XRE family transcriptional regulator [Clostridium taeniosporum]
MLCERLKELREEIELKQEEVAAKLNMGRSTYANYETGRAEPGISVLKDIASFYNVSIDFLCGYTNIREQYIKDKRKSSYVNDCLKIYEKFLK